MKELSIKEKAYDGNYKVYTELINRLENVKNAIKKQNYGIAMDILYKPYPEYQITTSTELKECEDLRITKAIKYGLDHVFTNNTTVFEVTKEQCLSWLEKQGEHANFINKIQIGDKVTRNEDGVLVNLSQLKRVAKPAEEYNITGIGSKNAQGKLGEMIKNLKPVNEALEKETPESWNEFLDGQKSVNIDYISGIRKELLNIEDNAENIDGLAESQWVAIRAAHRLLGEYMAKEQKPAWSEEDEKMIDAIYSCVDSHYDGLAKTSLLIWLKSLRPQSQWKPSESEVRILEQVIDGTANPINYHATLHAILEKLKKLREE